MALNITPDSILNINGDLFRLQAVSSEEAKKLAMDSSIAESIIDLKEALKGDEAAKLSQIDSINITEEEASI
jgi:hypothetical protein